MPASALGALADLVDQRAADDARVVGEVLMGDGDGLKHGQILAAKGSARRHDSGLARTSPSTGRFRRRSRAPIRACSWALHAEIEDIWNSWPEPSSRWRSSGSPQPSVTTPPASRRHSHGAARSYGELLSICPPPTRWNSSRIPGTSSISREPTSTTASSWPVTTRVIANACEPSSNVPPPTEEASISSPSTSTVSRAGRPRNP